MFTTQQQQTVYINRILHSSFLSLLLSFSFFLLSFFISFPTYYFCSASFLFFVYCTFSPSLSLSLVKWIKLQGSNNQVATTKTDLLTRHFISSNGITPIDQFNPLCLYCVFLLCHLFTFVWNFSFSLSLHHTASAGDNIEWSQWSLRCSNMHRSLFRTKRKAKS